MNYITTLKVSLSNWSEAGSCGERDKILMTMSAVIKNIKTTDQSWEVEEHVWCCFTDSEVNACTLNTRFRRKGRGRNTEYWWEESMQAFDLLDLQLNGHYYGLVACRISLMHPLNGYKQVIHVQHESHSCWFIHY